MKITVSVAKQGNRYHLTTRSWLHECPLGGRWVMGGKVPELGWEHESMSDAEKAREQWQSYIEERATNKEKSSRRRGTK